MTNSYLKPIRISTFLRPIHRHRWILFLSFISVVGTVSYLTFNTEPIYESKAALLIGETRNLNSVLNVSNVIKEQTLLKNQITVLKSRSVAEDVVRRMDAANINDSIFNQNIKQSMVFKLPLIRSKAPKVVIHSFEEKVDLFRENTKVVDDIETNVFILKARNTNPFVASEMINNWIDAYQNYDQENNQSEVSHTKRFLEEKLHEVEMKLSQASYELAVYQKANDVVSLPQETEQLIIQQANFEKLYQESRTSYEEVENQINHLTKELDQNKKRLLDEMINPVNPNLKELQKQLSVLIVKKAAYEAQLTGAGAALEKNESLDQMQNRIEGIQDQISSEVKKIIKNETGMINPLDRSEIVVNKLIDLQSTRQALGVRIETLKSITKDFQLKLSSMPEKGRELAILQRDVEVNQQLFLMLNQKYEEVRIKEAGQTGFIQIVDRARPSKDPILPRTKLNLIIASIFGLFLGLSIAFIKDIFDDHIDDPEDFEKSGIPLIGKIPLFQGVKPRNIIERQKNWKILRAKQIAPNLILRKNLNWIYAEAYKAIRTKIEFAKRENQWTTFLFTSPGAYEGKSTTVANLAITMAEKGLKTLLIDADLRKPVLDILFTGSSKNIGITKYFERTIKWTGLIRATSTDNLFLLPAGNPVLNASELLSSKGMVELIGQVKKHFAIVRIDSPPILQVTDPTVLSSMVDAVIIIAKSGQTQLSTLQQSIELLKGVDAKILGGIITGVRGKQYRKYRYNYRPDRSI